MLAFSFKIFALYILAIAVFFGCGSADRPQLYSRYSYIRLDLFDTFTNILGYAQSQDDFDYFQNIISAELYHLNRHFDMFNEYPGINNIRTINQNAGIQAVSVHPDIICLLQVGKEAYRNTDGLVNIAIGPVTDIWRRYISAAEEVLPDMAALQEANKLANIDDIIIDEENSTVFLAQAGMSLDVGSIGKGFAIERAAQRAMDAGFTSFVLSVGGDVRLAGGPKSGERDYWGVGIQDPHNPSEIIERIFTAETAVFTSGNYLRYYTVAGQKYHHIIDPRTLMPANTVSSATVIHPNAITAEYLSLAAFIYGPMFQSDYTTIWVLENGRLVEV